MRIRSNKGFTLIELLIVVAIIGIIAAIAVPGLMRARQSGNETSAIGSLSAINKGEASFAATCGENYYASNLTDLATGPTATPNAGYISPDLKPASGTTVSKSGYTIEVAADGASAVNPQPGNVCNGATVVSGYHATASTANSGSRNFGTNTTSTIWAQANSATAMTVPDAAAPAAPAKPIQ